MIRNVETPHGLRPWLTIAAGAVLVGLFNANIVLTSGLAEGSDFPSAYPYIMELTGSLCALVLLPFLLPFMIRFPLGRDNWWRRLPLHVAGSMVYGVVHTLLMWGSRTVIYRLLEWPAFDFGAMGYRFLMEYQKQVLFYAAVYGVLAMMSYVRHNRERQLRAAQLESRLNEARLTALKMQLNPHFLFNTMNMISSLVHDDPAGADRMLTRLADFLRLTLRHAEAQEVTLARELEFIDAYLNIMKARFGDRLAVFTEIASGAERVIVPHMLLQPLVENAVTHATEDAGPGCIHITAVRRDRRLRLTVRDDGNGPEAPSPHAGGGLGLANTQARLWQLYGDDHALSVTCAEQRGCLVTVEVPWNQEESS
ncbi:MAG: histidine kinase [bacterium]